MIDDVRVALRRLRTAPAFTAVAVMTLALAIGANTAIFSVADAVLFRPLPYPDPEDLHVLAMVDTNTGERSRGVRFAYLQALDDHHRGLGPIGLRGPTTMTIHPGGDSAEWMETVAVSPAYLRVLGVSAVEGRLFEASDTANAGGTAVLTYESWQRRFAGDPNIVGRAVQLGARTRDVVGVLPRDFMLPATSLQFLYSPTGRPEYLTAAPAQPRDAGPDASGGVVLRGFVDEPIVRLRPGVTRQQAQAEIDAIVAPLQDGREERVVLESPRAVLFPAGRPIMAFLVAAAAFVLLIGCGNLAAMLLARTRDRERDIGLHAALGASRLRIVRPIVLETFIVGIAASMLALLVTALTFDVLLRQVPPVAYGSATVQLDLRVAVFAVALGLLAGVVFAVVPSWRCSRVDVLALVQGRPAARYSRHGAFEYPMIAAQVALALVLVFGAVVAARAFVSVLRVPLGFSPDDLIAINARPSDNEVPSLRGFYVRAIETLAQRADVLAAGAGGSIPPDGFGRADAVAISGSQRPVDVLHVLPGYFEAVGMRLVRGRLLTWDDLRSGVGAVVAESAARALFPNQDALGATFGSRDGRQFTIVGIVGDVQRSLTGNLDPPAYVVPPADSTRGMTIVARMRARRARTLPDIRRAIGALAPDTPVTGVWWADSVNALAAYRNPRFQTLVLGTFAVLALGLTALGIFAAVAAAVAARTREMGVRLAVGAEPRSLVRLMVLKAMTAVLVGILAGLLATHWVRRLAEIHLFEVDARDPATLAAAAVTVAAAALVAAYLPARHASRVDPIVVLRAQ